MAFKPQIKQQIDERLQAAPFSDRHRANFYVLADAWKLHSQAEAEELLRAADRHILSPDPLETITNVQETAQRLGLPETAYRKMVLKQPTLATHSAEKVEQSVDGKTKAFGIERSTLLNMAKRHPQLLYLSTELLSERIDTMAEKLGVPRADYVKAVTKNASLCIMPPDTLLGHVDASAAALEVGREAFIKAALKQPTLFLMGAEKIRGNMQEVAQRLGIELRPMIDAAMRQPSLFYLKPESIETTITTAAELLGVARDVYTQAALKQPQLFYLDPQNIARHAKLTQRLYRGAGQEISNEQLLQNPNFLTRSDSAIIGRIIVQQKGLLTNTPLSLMVKPNAKIERPIREHYEGRLTGNPSQDAQVTRTMQQLHRLGIISELPKGISPMTTAKSR